MTIVLQCGKFIKELLPLVLLWLVNASMPTRGAVAQEVGEVFRDCTVCPEMVVLPPGSFVMGSPDTEEGRYNDEGPQHEVTIDYAFAVGVYEVTFEEWDACVRGGGCGAYEPSDQGWGRGRRPVVWVNWEDAWLYADWLAEQTGEQYRLLSEAEWEYVARAGTRTARYWGETDREQCQYANGYDANGHAEHGFARELVGCRDRQPNSAPVGSYRPNGLGVFDILGNVREWVDDCANGSYEGAPTDGSSWYRGDCTRRITRGGSWLHDPSELRSAYRRGSKAEFRNFALGFRVARTVN
ncbi:MAG: formylglycine-generating enzyme family protein [Gemmatimonadetes bacterium]|nr:formylglycine-generating enzyme family protein [Gemmatimonadota bacterium]